MDEDKGRAEEGPGVVEDVEFVTRVFVDDPEENAGLEMLEPLDVGATLDALVELLGLVCARVGAAELWECAAAVLEVPA